MFCFQCEQAAQHTGCTAIGVCGKDPETAALQDLLVYVLKGISMYANAAAIKGQQDEAIDRFTLEALFTTVTNVNFDPWRMQEMLSKSYSILNRAKELCQRVSPEYIPAATGPANWKPEESLDELVRQGEKVGIEARIQSLGHDLSGLQEMLIYGIKGMAAYADHAWILGKKDDKVAGFIYKALDYIAGGETTPDGLLELSLECGQVNYRVMELLDEGHRDHFGAPQPTQVQIDPVKGKCILISGHDLPDLEALLQQTEGLGINVYTHGEMLPAHGYPELKKYPHLVGNYGGAWQDQAREFDRFPGPILMTTNCIQKPKISYMDRIFTCGMVAWPEVTHIYDRDFSAVIAKAQAMDGFVEEGKGECITVGFAHDAVLGVADKVVDAVKAGQIKHFFVVGGCDGAKSGRNYYTDFTEQAPDDTVILTLGCGKYRFNKMEFGTVAGLPRLLDCGQCNDAFSAIKIALALAEAFDCGVNELPLTLNISWYEQKAVAVLLTLLSLDIKNIHLGPTLPTFATPGMIKILQDKFDLKPIGEAAADLEECLS